MPAWLRDALLPVLGLLVLGATLLGLLLFLFQDRLIFFPQPLDARAAHALQRTVARSEPFTLDTDDGVRLQGWFIRGEGHPPWPLVIYFGGNAEEVSWLLPEWPRVSDWALLLVNYRGYGLSGGRPSEQVMYRDALALYDRVLPRSDVDSAHVVVFARSLGTGVATYLASRRPVAGVVLVSPYDSLVELARGVYPLLPVKLLLRHRFDSAARAPQITAPLLAIAGAQDTLIRPERSRALVQAWGGPARLEVLGGVEHNDVHLHPAYWSLIVAFLRKVGGLQPSGSNR